MKKTLAFRGEICIMIHAIKKQKIWSDTVWVIVMWSLTIA